MFFSSVGLFSSLFYYITLKETILDCSKLEAQFSHYFLQLLYLQISPKLPAPHWRECHFMVCASKSHQLLNCASALRCRTLPLPLHIVWIRRAPSVLETERSYATAPFICLSVLLQEWNPEPSLGCVMESLELSSKDSRSNKPHQDSTCFSSLLTCARSCKCLCLGPTKQRSAQYSC